MSPRTTAVSVEFCCAASFGGERYVMAKPTA